MRDVAVCIGKIQEGDAQLTTTAAGLVKALLQHVVVLEHAIMREEALLTVRQDVMAANPLLQPTTKAFGIQLCSCIAKGDGPPIPGIRLVPFLVNEDSP